MSEIRFGTVAIRSSDESPAEAGPEGTFRMLAGVLGPVLPRTAQVRKAARGATTRILSKPGPIRAIASSRAVAASRKPAKPGS